MQKFIFGGDTGLSYADIRNRQRVADAMLAQAMSDTPNTIGSGIASIGQAYFGRQKADAAARDMEAGRKNATDVFNAVFEANRSKKPEPEPEFSRKSVYDAIQSVESANNPDAVSSKGATGLMQVMPATARDPGYGVPDIFETAKGLGVPVADESDAVLQALLKNPEVNRRFGENYYDAMEGKYGSQELALAAYNAGPGAVDQHGGVPPYQETQDYVPKVQAALMAQQGQPAAQPAAPSGPTMDELIQLLGNEFLNDGQRAVVEAMLAQQFQTPEEMTPYQQAQLDLQNRRLQAQLDGRLKTGTTVNVGGQENSWGDPPKDHVWLRDDQGAVMTEPAPGGKGLRPISAPVAGTASEEERMVTFENAVITADTMLDVIDGVATDAQLGNATGWGSYVPLDIPGVNARVRSRMEQLQGQLFLQAFESLKGGGQITEVEGRKAEQAMARLKAAQPYDDYRDALKELREVIAGARGRYNDRLPENRRADPLGEFNGWETDEVESDLEKYGG